MEFVIDRSGAPLVKFSKQKYIHVLPVTKYQLERFIWQIASFWCDYEVFLKDTERITPQKITPENFPAVFVTNINFEEALIISKWLGARPPVIKEWDEAYEVPFERKSLFREALNFITKVKRRQKVDKRIEILLDRLDDFGIQRKDLCLKIGEFACEFQREPYGRIYLKSENKNQALVTGSPSKKTRGENFGFCGVI
jgi:hypothetical protein